MSYFDEACGRARGLCALLGTARPMLNAPMREAAGPELVAAVSEAGGLGVIPAADMTPEEITAFGEAVRKLTEKPFAVNLRPEQTVAHKPEDLAAVGEALEFVYDDLGLPHWEALAAARPADAFYPDYFAQFDAALALRPAAMISSFGGFREPEAERLEALGIHHVGTATTLKEAKVLRAAGAEAIIVQGAEAAGPRASFEDADDTMMGLSALVPAVARATGLPVIAAGGVCGAAQAAGLAVAGASGFVLGTALVGTEESRAPGAHRWCAVHGVGSDTVTTRLFSGRTERVYRTGLVEAVEHLEDRTAPWPGPEALFAPLFRAAAAAGRDELLVFRVGQSAGRSAFAKVEDAVRTVTSWIPGE